MIPSGFWAVVPDEGCSKDSTLWIHFHSTWPRSQHSLERLAEPKFGAVSQLSLLEQRPKTSAWGGARPSESHTRSQGSFLSSPSNPAVSPSSRAWYPGSLGRGSCTAAGLALGTGTAQGQMLWQQGIHSLSHSSRYPVPCSAHCLAHAFITWSMPAPIAEPGAGFLHGALITRQLCRDGLSDPVSGSPFRLCGFWLSVTLTGKEIKSLHRAKWFCKICSESYQPDAFIKLHLWPRLDKRKGVAN